MAGTEIKVFVHSCDEVRTQRLWHCSVKHHESITLKSAPIHSHANMVAHNPDVRHHLKRPEVSRFTGLISPSMPKGAAPDYLVLVGNIGNTQATPLAQLGHLGVESFSSVDLLEMAIRIARGGEFEH